MNSLYRIMTYVCIAVVSSIAGTHVHAKNTSGTDSLLNSDYIYSICVSDPERALKLTDEAEERHLISRFRSDHLRSLIYQNGLNMYRLALQYSLKTYQSDSVRLYPEKALPIISMIADQYNSVGNYTESTRYAVEGIEIARRAGIPRSEAILLLYIGMNKRDVGLKDEAEKYVEQARHILEKVNADSCGWKAVDDLIYIYGAKLTYAMYDEKYAEAIDLLPDYERIVGKLKNYPDAPQGLYDMRRANGYIAYAYIFLADGNPEKGAEFYRRFEETDYARSDDGKQARFHYLVAAGRYKEALDYIHADKQRWRAQGDTINYYYLERDLTFEAQAYEGLGDHERAAQAYKQMYIVADSLRIREKHNGVLELATIYETKEKEARLVEQATQLRESRMIVFFGACIILLLGVVLWRNVRHSRLIKRKNETMAGSITELLKYKDELYRSKDELYRIKEANRLLQEQLAEAATATHACTDEKREEHQASEEHQAHEEHQVPDIKEADTEESFLPNDMELFDQVEHEIINQRLFLLPESQREELIKTVHIPKNRFPLLFKQYAGMSFSRYMNKLRLEYAVQLLQEHPEYSIDAIAQSCGISSASTFYRLFSEVYGMTPKEFRSSLKTSEKEEDTD